MSFELDRRNGWPAELRVLLERHPRHTWAASDSPLAQFWLDRHDDFRRESAALESKIDDYRAERISSQDFAIWAAPRMQAFVAHLHGHHQIEDFHYFPSFKAAEPRLAVGFDTLEKDHESLHAGIVKVFETVDAFMTTARDRASKGADRHAGARFADAGLELCRRLLRHLDDEEDLIIPLMLERR